MLEQLTNHYLHYTMYDTLNQQCEVFTLKNVSRKVSCISLNILISIDDLYVLFKQVFSTLIDKSKFYFKDQIMSYAFFINIIHICFTCRSHTIFFFFGWNSNKMKCNPSVSIRRS